MAVPWEYEDDLRPVVLAEALLEGLVPSLPRSGRSTVRLWMSQPMTRIELPGPLDGGGEGREVSRAIDEKTHPRSPRDLPAVAPFLQDPINVGQRCAPCTERPYTLGARKRNPVFSPPLPPVRALGRLVAHSALRAFGADVPLAGPDLGGASRRRARWAREGCHPLFNEYWSRGAARAGCGAPDGRDAGAP